MCSYATPTPIDQRRVRSGLVPSPRQGRRIDALDRGRAPVEATYRIRASALRFRARTLAGVRVAIRPLAATSTRPNDGRTVLLRSCKQRAVAYEPQRPDNERARPKRVVNRHTTPARGRSSAATSPLSPTIGGALTESSVRLSWSGSENRASRMTLGPGQSHGFAPEVSPCPVEPRQALLRLGRGMPANRRWNTVQRKACGGRHPLPVVGRCRKRWRYGWLGGGPRKPRANARFDWRFDVGLGIARCGGDWPRRSGRSEFANRTTAFRTKYALLVLQDARVMLQDKEGLRGPKVSIANAISRADAFGLGWVRRNGCGCVPLGGPWRFRPHERLA